MAVIVRGPWRHGCSRVESMDCDGDQEVVYRRVMGMERYKCEGVRKVYSWMERGKT